MSVSPIGAAANYLMPYWQGQSSLLGQSQSGSSAYAPTPAAASQTGEPVSLSDAGRALSAQQGAASNGGTAEAGSSDFSQEAQLLSGVADKALAAMGIISVADEANTQVSFDALSYQVSSSTSASASVVQSQQGQQLTSQYGQQQEAVLSGEGHIVTADGRSFEFQIQLQLDQSEQISQSSSTGTGNTAGNGANASDASGGLASALPASLAQLFGSNSSGATSSASPSSATAAQNTTGNGPDSINWDAILKQSKSLIDLLDSLAGAGQATTSSVSTGNGAGDSAGSGATATSTVL